VGGGAGVGCMVGEGVSGANSVQVEASLPSNGLVVGVAESDECVE